MNQLTSHQIVKTMEGLVALCLGSSDRVVWVNQADAAAFSDGEKLYLPRPTGEHVGEYDLLLAIAMREVAKLLHSDTTQLAAVPVDVSPYAKAIEEARIKMVLGKTYLGAKSIFDTAIKVACDLLVAQAALETVSPERANLLAVWASSHDGLLNSGNSQQALEKLTDLASTSTDKQVLLAALSLAVQAVQKGSTVEAIELGAQVMLALRADPPEQEQSQSPSEEGQEGQETPPQDVEQADQANDQQPGETPDAGPQEGAQSQSEPSSNTDGPDSEVTASDSNQPAQEGCEEKDGSEGDSPSDARPPAGEQPQDQAPGGTPESDQPEAGAPNSDGPAGQEGESAGQKSDCQGDKGNDPAQTGGTDASTEAAPTDGAGGESEASSGDGSPSDANSPAADQPQENASGETPESGQPAAGDPGSPKEGEVPAVGEGASGSQTGGSQSQGNAADVLSDVLAMLKGFSGSVDVASQAGELRQLAVAAVFSPTESQIKAIESALELGENAAEALAEVVDTYAEAELEDALQPDGLSALLCAGDGYAEPDLEGTNSLLTGVQAKLVTVLLREFQDKRPRNFLRATSGHKIAAGQFWRFKKLGDTRVFRGRTLACGVDTAASILLDRSKSMEDSIEEAARVTYALAQAMQRIPGMQVSIDVFPAVEDVSEEVLGFKQNVRAAHRKLETLVADGGTPTGSALARRLPRLLGTNATRKLMLVINDGHPCGKGERPLTVEMLAAARARGVEVIGIGIGVDLSDLFEVSVTVDSVAELASAFEALFKGELAPRLAA